MNGLLKFRFGFVPVGTNGGMSTSSMAEIAGLTDTSIEGNACAP